jgi:hypothetical protein
MPLVYTVTHAGSPESGLPGALFAEEHHCLPYARNGKPYTIIPICNRTDTGGTVFMLPGVIAHDDALASVKGRRPITSIGPEGTCRFDINASRPDGQVAGSVALKHSVMIPAPLQHLL